MRAFLTASCLILWLAPALLAQVDATGTVLGRVTDPVDASLANAQVQVAEQQTGVSVAKTTDAQGNYTVPLLKPGIYSIQVSAPGFVTMTRKNLVLQVQQSIRQDFKLQIGRVQQEVTVAGGEPLLNTESGELGGVIAGRALEQLPLNGRNFSQLGLLVPGTNPGPVGGIRVQGNGNETQRAGAETVADGSRGSWNAFMIDGIDDRDQSVGTVKVFPNLESIQEFQVQTGNYDAQFDSGGAVVNVLTRSGSNQFHGSAFEFLRNAALDARQFFDASKPQFQQNQFGFSIGGPIRKDKTFFFGDYQGLRIHQAETSILSEPTAAMRTGDFRELLQLTPPIAIFDPQTGQQVVCNGVLNVICPGRVDPVANNLLAIFPLPNLPGVANNLRIDPLVVTDQDQFDVRVDHVFSQRDSIFARYTYGRADISYPSTHVFNKDGSINPLAFAQGSTIAGSLALNHAPSQQATVQEIHQFSSNLSNQLALGYTRFSLHVVSLNEGSNIASQLGLQGANTGPNAAGMTTLSISGEAGYDSGSLPEIVPQNTWELSDVVFYTHHSHLLRFGFSVLENRFGFFQLASPDGELDFSGSYTAGITTTVAGQRFMCKGVLNVNVICPGFGFADFFLGLPNSSEKSALPQGTPYARYGEYGAFVQDQWHATSRLGVSLGLRYDLFTPVSELHNRLSDFLVPSGTLLLAGHNGVFSSILGIQKHDFSPRIGLAYRVGNATVIRSAYGLYYFNEQGTGGSSRLFLNDPFEAQFMVSCSSTTPCLQTSDGIPQTPSAINLPNAVYQPTANQTPNLQQWNLTLEHQFGSSLVLRAAYVGSHGNHLNININENVGVPGPGPPASRRPFPTYGAISSWEPRGISNYNALQLSAEQRYSRGLSFLAAYTWSRSLDEGGGGNSSTGDPRINIQDPRNLRANYGLSSFDFRQRFTLSTVYELPFGRGRKFMNHANSFANALAGGWQAASIVTAQSGAPFSVFVASPTSNTGTFQRPNRVCNGNLASAKQSINQWFDVACFEIPPIYTFGNAGRNILIGPGLFTWDFAVDKDFPIHDRLGLQFRSEFFNLTNRANFGQPNASIGSPAAGTITTVVTNARQIQFALRLHW